MSTSTAGVFAAGEDGQIHVAEAAAPIPAEFLGGITVNTSPIDLQPIKQMRMLRFDGQRWNYFEPMMTE